MYDLEDGEIVDSKEKQETDPVIENDTIDKNESITGTVSILFFFAIFLIHFLQKILFFDFVENFADFVEIILFS